MTINELKNILSGSEKISFQLPDGNLVPAHFHVTEVGKVRKDFIDCGGTVRFEEVANFQLWEKDDYDHRLHPEKLINIIELSQKVLGLGDLPIEVEYQGTSIQKYGLDYNGSSFLLTTKHTACLAEDQCGVEEKPKINLSTLTANACTPGGGCC